MTFSQTEKSRYSRQALLPDFGWEAQSKLKSASVLIIGAGGLGCPCSLYLAGAGVGHIALVDHDTVDLSNLHRQVLFTEADVGKSKVEIAGNRLRAFNSEITITSLAEKLTPANAESLVSKYDLVIDCSDNFVTRYAVNDACVRQKKPLLSASVFQHEGQLSLFNYRGGPCYRCLFPESGKTLNCAEAGVLGAIPGILGTIQAAEAIKVLTDGGTTLAGRLLTIDAATMKFREFSFQRKSDCACVTGKFPAAEEACGLGDFVSPQELKALLADSSVILVDVRTKEEHERDHLAEDRLIPLSDIEKGNFPEFPSGAKVITYCASGIRSQRACLQLKRRGVSARTLTGGLEAWRRAQPARS